MNRVGQPRQATQQEQGVWSQIAAFHARVAETVERTLSNRFDLSLSEYSTLQALAQAESGEGMRMQALADAIGLNQSSVSRLVARLERQDLVERNLNKRDRRGVFTRITDAGREQLAAATPVYLQTLAAEFDKAIADPELQEVVKRICE
jgi:DNA-binding MarR family transcriptional regulator